MAYYSGWIIYHYDCGHKLKERKLGFAEQKKITQILFQYLKKKKKLKKGCL